MLSNFVRGKTMVVVVLIALFAGLGFFGADYSFRNAGTGSENCYIKVYGRCYRLQEAERLAEFHRLANELFLIDFARSLFGEDRLDRDPTDFVMGLIVLRREAKRLGVEPTLEEVQKAVPNLPRFRLQPNLDADLIKNNLLGPYGMTEGDLFQLVKDYLSWQRIQDLLEAGLRVPPSEIEKQYLLNYQQFTASLVKFDRADFEEKVEVTEDDIKQYYEANKDTLLSDEKRVFQTVTFIPPKVSKEMTEEEKAKQKPLFANKVNEVYAELAAAPADYEKIAKAAIEEVSKDEAKKTIGGIELTTLEPFSRFEPPEQFEDQPELLSGLFGQSLTLDRPVTIPVAIPMPEKEDASEEDDAKEDDAADEGGTAESDDASDTDDTAEEGDGDASKKDDAAKEDESLDEEEEEFAGDSYVVFKLIEILPPAPLTLEEARENITTVLENQKSDQMVNEAANVAHAKITEALEAGKSIAEAAKAAGVELEPLDPFSKSEPPKEIDDPNGIIMAALETEPQSVSRVIPQPGGKGYQVLLVDKIVLVESEDEERRKRSLENVARGEFRRALFQAWFDEVKRKSGAERSKPIEVEEPPPSTPETA